jgi:hypothetical protein
MICRLKLQGESVQELIGRTVEVYCGEGNPYQSLVILFDEFENIWNSPPLEVI